jgi:multisubunit Na+/H+ antiporter MnhC subunit
MLGTARLVKRFTRLARQRGQYCIVLVGVLSILGNVAHHSSIQYLSCDSATSCAAAVMYVTVLGPLVVGLATALVAVVLAIIRYREKWNVYVKKMVRVVSRTNDHDHDVIPDPNQKPGELIIKYVHVPRYNGEKSFVGAVVRACKIKFPRGVRSEAQSMAVSDYAVRYMKEHGHRTDHIARDLPMVVALYYLPSKHEVRAVKATRSEYYQDRLAWREQNRLL